MYRLNHNTEQYFLFARDKLFKDKNKNDHSADGYRHRKYQKDMAEFQDHPEKNITIKNKL